MDKYKNNKKIILKKLLVLILIVCAIFLIQTKVSYATIDNNKTWDVSKQKDKSIIATLDNTGTLTISGKGEMEDYSSYNEAPWRNNKSSVKNIKIGEGVTSIGDYSFYDIGDLAVNVNVQISNSVTDIGNYAFYFCSALTQIYIPSGVESIGECAFDGCIFLNTIKVDNNNTMYSDVNGVLYSKDKTEIIKYPEGIAEREYTILNGVKKIGDNAFANCLNLTSVEIPSSVTSIGKNVFAISTKLTNIKVDSNNAKYSDINGVLYSKEKNKIIRYPEGKTEKEFRVLSGVQSIEENAFYNCINLTKIEMTSDVTNIGEGAFLGCKNLRNIQLSEKLTSIGDYAFSGCTSLEYISIPSSVKNIGDAICSGCKNLTSISVDSDNGMYIDKDGVLYSKDKKEILIYPAGKTETEYTILNGVTNIADYAFANSESLTSIEIPNTVTDIGDNAFLSCWYLTTIEIPNKVDKIGKGAFYECARLTDIKIPNGITSIEGYTFAYCNNLQNVTIPESVTSIGEDAFFSCENIKEITIPKSVTKIEQDAFKWCLYTTLSCYPGTEAERYAQENDIKYQLISLDSVQDETTIQENKINAWIVYIGIGVLIIVLVIIGIIVYKKHNFYKI